MSEEKRDIDVPRSCSICNSLIGGEYLVSYGFILCEGCIVKILREGDYFIRDKKPQDADETQFKMSFENIVKNIGIRTIKAKINSKEGQEIDDSQSTLYSKQLLTGIINRLTKEIENLISNGKMMESKMIEMRSNEEKYKLEIETLTKKLNDTKVGSMFRKNIDKMRNLMKKETKKTEKNIEKLQYNDDYEYLEHNPQKEFNFLHDFLWIIDDFTSIAGKYSSPTFQKDDYSLCLSGYYGGLSSDLLKISLHVMRGEMDDDLLWPMRYTATIGIHNQNTFDFHDKKQITYADFPNKEFYDRPITDKNKGIGSLIIKGSDLRYIGGLMKKGTIMISCILELPYN